MPPCVWENRFFWHCGHDKQYSFCGLPRPSQSHNPLTAENRCLPTCDALNVRAIVRDFCSGCTTAGVLQRPMPLSTEELWRRRREAGMMCTDLDTIYWVRDAIESHRLQELGERIRELERAQQEARRRERRTRWEDNLTARRLLELRNRTARRDRRMFIEHDDDEIFVAVALEDLPEDDRNCPICLEPFSSGGSMQAVEVPCRHRFQVRGAEGLVGTCPLCRNERSFLQMPDFDDDYFTDDGLSDEARTVTGSSHGSDDSSTADGSTDGLRTINRPSSTGGSQTDSGDDPRYGESYR
jgi:hypothetical protein